MALRRTKTVKPNPFVPAAPDPQAEAAKQESEPVEPVMIQRGPREATGGEPPEHPLLELPKVWPPKGQLPQGTAMQVLGLHGGAGVSTICGLLAGRGFDAGRGFEGLRSADVPVLLVARTSAHGADMVARAAHQWASFGFPEGLRVAGVLLVDDAPKVPEELEHYVRYNSRAWPVTWRMRWCEAIRCDPDPPSGPKGLPVWARSLTKSLLKETAPVLSTEEEQITTEGEEAS